MRLLFIGPPGAGKGTQAARVAERLGIPHISTGDLFRDNVSHGSDLGKLVDEIMKRGDYVPDEITVALLADRIAQDDASDGFILDGFPRTEGQVEALDELLGDDGLDRVVLFSVDQESLTRRMLDRGRTDDTEETIRNRFEVYEEQTAPLIKIYEERDLVVTVDGNADVLVVTDRALAAL